MLISKFTAKVDVSQTTVTLIFRKLKNDERDHDRERKFVPKRLVTRMDAKGKQRRKLQKWGEQLQHVTFQHSTFYFSPAYMR